MKRICKQCGVVLEVEEFALAGTINGKKYYRHLCKSCYWESKKPRIEQNRNWIKEFKKTLKCEKCGNNDYRVLEFHHPNNDKEYNVADIASFGIETIKKEIEKCEVLCSNCHKIIHYNE